MSGKGDQKSEQDPYVYCVVSVLQRMKEEEIVGRWDNEEEINSGQGDEDKIAGR